MIQLLLIALLSSQLTLEQKIQKLNPELKPQTVEWIANTLEVWMPKVGLDNENLVLALIYKESTFIHMYQAGADGEWGLLQVIPTDNHIQNAILKYRCTEDEQKALFAFNDEFGRKQYYRPCRCAAGSITKCDLPNVGFVDKNGRYQVDPRKAKLFLKYSPRGALVVGLYELKYWQRKYDNKLKKLYWDSFPAYWFKAEERETWRKWWAETKKNLGDNVWVVHHNYGGTIKRNRTARWYPRMVHTLYAKIQSWDKD